MVIQGQVNDADGNGPDVVKVQLVPSGPKVFATVGALVAMAVGLVGLGLTLWSEWKAAANLEVELKGVEVKWDLKTLDKINLLLLEEESKDLLSESVHNDLVKAIHSIEDSQGKVTPSLKSDRDALDRVIDNLNKSNAVTRQSCLDRINSLQALTAPNEYYIEASVAVANLATTPAFLERALLRVEGIDESFDMDLDLGGVAIASSDVEEFKTRTSSGISKRIDDFRTNTSTGQPWAVIVLRDIKENEWSDARKLGRPDGGSPSAAREEMEAEARAKLKSAKE